MGTGKRVKGRKSAALGAGERHPGERFMEIAGRAAGLVSCQAAGAGSDWRASF